MPILRQQFTDKRNSFSASHFLLGYGKCERLHGHNYQVEVLLEYQSPVATNSIDFKLLNQIIREEISPLNQKVLLPKDSAQIQIAPTADGKNWKVLYGEKEYSFPKQDVSILEGLDKTTSENLAIYMHKRLVNRLKQAFPEKISKMTIKISETENNHAIYTNEVK